MNTDVNLLGKALIKLAILVFLLILSPTLITIAYKAIKLYPEGIAYGLSLLFLVFAGSLVIFTLFFAFKTFGTISKAIFNK